jgi:putative phosphoribosyl transferase
MVAAERRRMMIRDVTTHAGAVDRPLVRIPAGEVDLYGELEVPAGACGLVLFAHGSGSGRLSPRNRHVAQVLRAAGIGTLLFDLLTHGEEADDIKTSVWRFDIGLLSERLAAATRWVLAQPELGGLKIGYFGASTGAAAALRAAVEIGADVSTVVSRGGRPDLAGPALPLLACPVLLIVGGLDEVVLHLNEEAMAAMTCDKQMRVVPGASHLFEERGKLDEVARIAADWFCGHLARPEEAGKPVSVGET